MLTGFVLIGAHVGNKLKRKYADSPFLDEDFPVRDWQILYCQSARSWTVVPDSFAKLVKQQVRWKKSFIRASSSRGATTGASPFSRPWPTTCTCSS